MSSGAQVPRRERAREQTPQLDVLNTVLALLIEAGDLAQAAPAVLRELTRGLGFDLAQLWLVSARAEGVELVGTLGAEPVGLRALSRDFPANVFSRQQVTWATELSSAPRADAAARAGAASAVWIPIVSTKDVVGVIELFSREPREVDPLLVAMLRTLGQTAGHLAERAKLEQDLWDAEARFRRSLRSAVEERTTELSASRAWAAERQVLAEASALLLSSLDEARMLHSVAELVVGSVAAVCLIDVVEGDSLDGGVLRRAAAAPDKDLGGGGAPYEKSLPARVARAGRADVVRGVTAADLGMTELSASGPLFAVIVPLIARGQTLGAITLCGDWEVDDDRLSFVQDLAARVAAALDNLHLLRRLQEAVSERDEFLSVAAHELRTPITTLKLQLDIIREHAHGASDQRLEPRLERALRQADRLERLIERLLDVSRIMSKPLDLERQNVDLAELVKDVADQLRPQAERYGSKIVVRAQPARGFWDRDRLEQVVTNLLLNALQYGASRQVEVTVSATSQRGRLSITDHGIGIAQKDVGRIFERFERAVSSHHYGGLGLGLFVANQVVQAHGGEIIVDSTPGMGSTFTVVLPLTLQPSARDAEPAVAANTGGQGSLILVVEDDVDASQVVADLLADHGFVVRTAADGREAFDALQQGLRPALVLLDMMLPRMDGWQLMSAIKRDPELASLPVVLFSAHADVARAAEELGAAGYLEKPLGVDALLSAIVRHAHTHGTSSVATPRQYS